MAICFSKISRIQENPNFAGTNVYFSAFDFAFLLCRGLFRAELNMSACKNSRVPTRREFLCWAVIQLVEIGGSAGFLG